MHFVRRAALRAASSTSFVTRPRTINNPSPFLLRASTERIASPAVFRRFASDDAHERIAEEEEESLEDADREEQSTVQSAVDSAKSYASDAAESVKDTVSYGTEAAAGSLGFGGGSQQRNPSFVQHNVPPSNGCYIGNLLFDVTEEDLRREFEGFGPLKMVRLHRDARGLSKGFAHIEYETVESATAAIEAKNQTIFEGRRVIVNYINRTPRSREMNPPSKTLFIGNLAFEMSDSDLNSLFRDIRNVIDVRVAIDRRTGQPRGFAHADFVDVESAMKAMEQLHGKQVFDRALRVDYSLGERNPGGRGGGAGGPRF